MATGVAACGRTEVENSVAKFWIEVSKTTALWMSWCCSTQDMAEPGNPSEVSEAAGPNPGSGK